MGGEGGAVGAGADREGAEGVLAGWGPLGGGRGLLAGGHGGLGGGGGAWRGVLS